MPRKRITFIVIPTNDGQVREYRFAPWVLSASVVAGIGLATLFAFFAVGYFGWEDQRENLALLSEENDILLRNLELVRKGVGDLEKTVDVLRGDDERLRYYHEMEPLSTEGGVGGWTLHAEESGNRTDLPTETINSLPSSKRVMLRDLNLTVDRLQRQAHRQVESFQEIEQQFIESQEGLRHFPTISPVPKKRTWISSGYGSRKDPFTGRKSFHTGVDFAGRSGTPIYATADGVVRYAYKDVRLGNVVVVEHDIRTENEKGVAVTREGMYRSEYAHLERILVKVGDWVSRRDQIGTMGSTGRSTGPHLHYAVRFQDRRRGGYLGYDDPRKYVLDIPRNNPEIPPDEEVSGWGKIDD
jgi:murein DD-endopeptidase MepM/ murein hydrolase activator NlpD